MHFKRGVLLVIITILAVPMTGYIIGNLYFSDSRVIKINWGIEIPSNFKKVYKIRSPIGFHGDGEKYMIYDTNGKNFAFINNFSGIKNKSAQEYVQSVATGLNVPKEKRPDFDKKYFWWETVHEEDGSHLILLYYPENKRVYLIEQLM